MGWPSGRGAHGAGPPWALALSRRGAGPSGLGGPASCCRLEVALGPAALSLLLGGQKHSCLQGRGHSGRLGAFS